MKVQEIKNIILAKTNLTVTKAHQKALRVVLGQITLASVIGEETKTESASKQKIYIPRGYFYKLGMEEVTITRKVTDIKKEEFNTYGKVKISKQILDVYRNSDNEWTLA